MTHAWPRPLESFYRRWHQGLEGRTESSRCGAPRTICTCWSSCA